jgi:predicted ATPase/class 3 adenylate cyclase
MDGDSTTLLFTDIEGSTRMLDRLGESYAGLLTEHHRILREAIAGSGGSEVDTAGDSFFAVFARAADAVACAQRVQLALSEHRWPDGEAPRVRMGIHTGSPSVSDGNFVGIDVHRAARVMAVAYGGQVLLTEQTVRTLEPSIELRDLGYHRLKDLPAPEHLFQLVAAGLEIEFPQLRSLNRSNLPTPANAFIGRQAELAQALELLSSADVRLLTLLGPGGAGKTRLAIEVGAEAVGRYRDGVWIVLLAPIADSALMVSELAHTLEVEPVAGQPLENTLAAALSERELLLVLDNFEHLLGSVGLVADLLAAAPGLDVLSTSREPLRIRAEQRMEVPPMTLTDASELFVQRARAIRPDLALTDEDQAAIERVCARLDGLPLAVELAAARIAVFRPAALEARLGERVALPEGPHDLPERQRTLRATIDWSYQMLDPEERALLRSLAPFIGGVRVDSAEAIWDEKGSDRLLSLAEKSLLRRREDPDAEPRFWMLETIREFASERSGAEGDAAAAVERHGQHYCALTLQAAPLLQERDQRRWLERLEAELANLRAALDHLTAHAPEQALQMANALRIFWDVRGYMTEARSRYAQVLAAAPADSPSRSEALLGAGRAALVLGETEQAEPLLLEALPLARGAGDARLTVHVLSHLSWAEWALGKHQLSISRGEEAIAEAHASGDEWVLALALNNQGETFRVHGDPPEARECYEQALDIRRRLGEPRAIALTASNLAGVLLDVGAHEQAESLLDEALSRAEEIDYRTIMSSAFALRAVLSLKRGDANVAASQLASAIDSTGADDVETAATLLSAAATLAATRDEPLRAASLWAASDGALARLSRPDPPATASLRARWLPVMQAAAADGTSWEEAWVRGGRLSLEEAFSLARESRERADRGCIDRS